MDANLYPHLARIAAPADLRRIPESELPAVAEELRRFLIDSVCARAGTSAPT